MPAIYAHRAFGEDVRRRLDGARFPEIGACPDSFALGLHGPDPLFYYHPLRANAVSRRGNRLHEESAAPFFLRAKETLAGRHTPAADVAYLYGFVCHFALDSVCHPEVARRMEEHSLSHAAVEAAFERAVLHRDGLDHRARIADHVRASEENISALAAYCSIEEREAKQAIRSMISCSRLLRAPNGAKRALLTAALRLAGSKSVIDMIVPARPSPQARQAAEALLPCYDRALRKAEELLENYRACLFSDGTLDIRFTSNYESEELL